MSELNIEIYTDNYYQGIVDLILNIQTKEFGVPITLDQQPDLNKIREFYQVNNGNFWVARSSGNIIGTIALLDIGNKQAALRKMFVDKDYRGRELGVGQQLLKTLLAWAKSKGINEIYLGTTQKFIAAQRFYEKNGFVELPKEELPESFPVMEVDVKFYCYSF